MGATVHWMSNKEFTRDWKDETNNTVIIKGNGHKEQVTKIRKVEGTAKNRKGESQGNIVFSDVLFLPNG
jgi:hypothetical protein